MDYISNKVREMYHRSPEASGEYFKSKPYYEMREFARFCQHSPEDYHNCEGCPHHSFSKLDESDERGPQYLIEHKCSKINDICPDNGCGEEK